MGLFSLDTCVTQFCMLDISEQKQTLEFLDSL